VRSNPQARNDSVSPGSPSIANCGNDGLAHLPA
jgi:hypothetical protein